MTIRIVKYSLFSLALGCLSTFSIDHASASSSVEEVKCDSVVDKGNFKLVCGEVNKGFTPLNSRKSRDLLDDSFITERLKRGEVEGMLIVTPAGKSKTVSGTRIDATMASGDFSRFGWRNVVKYQFQESKATYATVFAQEDDKMPVRVLGDALLLSSKEQAPVYIVKLV